MLYLITTHININSFIFVLYEYMNECSPLNMVHVLILI